MSRMGAIVLFLFLMNLSLAFVSGLGLFSFGTVATYYSVSQAAADYDEDKFGETNPGGLGAYGIELITGGLGMLITTVWNMTGGAYDLYKSIFQLIIGGSSGDSIALILTVIQNLILFIGLIEFASGRDTKT